MRSAYKTSPVLLAVVFAVCLGAAEAFAQTSTFTYQGKLTDGGAPANGNYDFQFALFDSLTGGTQIGSTQSMSNVSVSNGVFTVALDFGASSLSGANLYVEISARPTGSTSFTLLAPRQQITSTPYAVRSANASSANTLSTQCAGCITDTQIGSVAASKLTGTIPASAVPSGSTSYVQNTTTQQASTNLNISGNGTAGGTVSANILDATSQFSIGGNRILSNAGTNNLFAGIGSGQSNTAGSRNSFFGSHAGQANVFGSDNTFFGFNAGLNNTGGTIVSRGRNNAFFGSGAGQGNSIGEGNSFFGQGTGLSNTTGSFNSFFGIQAGAKSATGRLNTFIGQGADFTTANASGDKNTLLGVSAQVSSGLTNATAIGADATVTQSNSLVLGSIQGVNGATADTNVGIGTTAPQRALQLGASTDALFTFEPSSGSPDAGYIRFGDGTGWKLHIGRSREKSAASGGTLDTGTTGVLMTVQDNGNVGIGTTKPTVALEVQTDPNINVFDHKALAVHGNAVQDLNYFGFVRAMLYVEEDGTIARCYNSQVTGNASRLAPCGFRVIARGDGKYDVILGSPYDNTQGLIDLFWSVTAGRNSDANLLSAQAFQTALGTIRVVIRNQNASGFQSDTKNGSFMIVIY